MTEHQCAEHSPGSEACYCSHHCRCGACSTARARYVKRRKHLESQGVALIIDAAPIRSHLRRLVDSGMSVSDIAARSGYSRSDIINVLRGQRTRIRRSSAERVARVKPSGPERAIIDATGTLRRLQALIAIGWTQGQIAVACGRTTRGWTGEILRGSNRVHARVAKDIEAAYDAMWQGPKSPNVRSVIRAQRKSWPPPLAWDDGTGPHGIDNPDATPVTGTPRKLRTATEKIEEIDALAGSASSDQIARRLGYSSADSMATVLHRAGRDDVARRIRAGRAA